MEAALQRRAEERENGTQVQRSRPLVEARSQSSTPVQRKQAPLRDFAIGLNASESRLAALDRAVARVQLAVAGIQARSTVEVQTRAAQGVAGASGTLPHLDRIQSAFGRHDVSQVQSKVGGAAAEACDDMGALAYATGNTVAFKSSPDLHTAAHEAAHVVQQRGGVSLKGGVGQAGDRHEQHADAVADAVVAGRSAESLLDRYSGMSGGSGLQLKQGADAPYEDREGEGTARASALHGIANGVVAEIFFKVYEDELSSDDTEVLAELARGAVAEAASIEFEVVGRTDPTGDESKNSSLARARAHAVSTALEESIDRALEQDPAAADRISVGNPRAGTSDATGDNAYDRRADVRAKIEPVADVEKEDAEGPANECPIPATQEKYDYCMRVQLLIDEMESFGWGIDPDRFWKYNGARIPEAWWVRYPLQRLPRTRVKLANCPSSRNENPKPWDLAQSMGKVWHVDLCNAPELLSALASDARQGNRASCSVEKQEDKDSQQLWDNRNRVQDWLGRVRDESATAYTADMLSRLVQWNLAEDDAFSWARFDLDEYLTKDTVNELMTVEKVGTPRARTYIDSRSYHAAQELRSTFLKVLPAVDGGNDDAAFATFLTEADDLATRILQGVDMVAQKRDDKMGNKPGAGSSQAQQLVFWVRHKQSLDGHVLQAFPKV